MDDDFLVDIEVVAGGVVVVAVVAGGGQQLAGLLRVVAVVGKVAFVDADGAPLRNVADALESTVVEGLHQQLAVDAEGQGAAHVFLAEFRVPDVIGNQGKDFVVGTGIELGDGVDVLETDFHSPIAFAGANHRSAHQRLGTPDLGDILDGRGLGVVGVVGLIVLEGFEDYGDAAVPLDNPVGAEADGVGGLFVLGSVVPPFRGLESGKDGGTGENGAINFADHIDGHIIDNFAADDAVEAESAAAVARGFLVAEVVQAFLGGGGVPSFAVMEGYAVAEDEAPAVGSLLGPAFHAGQRDYLEVGAVNPSEGVTGDLLTDHGRYITAAPGAPGAEGVGFLLNNDNYFILGGKSGTGGGRRYRSCGGPGHGRFRGRGGFKLPGVGQSPGVGRDGRGGSGLFLNRGRLGRFRGGRFGLGRRLLSRGGRLGRRAGGPASHCQERQKDDAGSQAAPPLAPRDNGTYVCHAWLTTLLSFGLDNRRVGSLLGRRRRRCRQTTPADPRIPGDTQILRKLIQWQKDFVNKLPSKPFFCFSGQRRQVQCIDIPENQSNIVAYSAGAAGSRPGLTPMDAEGF